MSITRRLFLRNTAAAGVIGATAPAIAEPAQTDIQHFLDAASPAELAWYHTCQLAIALGKMDNTHTYRAHIDHEHQFALVVGDRKPEGGEA